MQRLCKDIIKNFLVSIDDNIFNWNIFNRYTNNIFKKFLKVEIIIQKLILNTPNFCNSFNSVYCEVG